MKQLEMQLNTAQLKSLRQSKGWTQQHLADVSGISLRTIQRAENKGATSIETLNALCAVFEVNRELLQNSKDENTKIETINKGWRVAIPSIALAQILAIFLVWLLLGSVSTFWLKTLLIGWIGIGFIYFVYKKTLSVHQLNNFQEMKDLNKKTLS